MNIIQKYIKESAKPIDATNIEMSDEDKKKELSKIENSFENKYHGFCLSASKYDIDKLESMLNSKKSELADAKKKRKNTSSKMDKKAIDFEISYLTKVCHKCGDMIRRKKKYS